MGGEVVDLVGLGALDDADEARDVGEIAIDEFDVVEDAEPAEALADDVGAGAAAHEADDAIAFAQEQLGQVGAILAGDAGDEGCGHGAPAGTRAGMDGPAMMGAR